MSLSLKNFTFSIAFVGKDEWSKKRNRKESHWPLTSGSFLASSNLLLTLFSWQWPSADETVNKFTGIFPRIFPVNHVSQHSDQLKVSHYRWYFAFSHLWFRVNNVLIIMQGIIRSLWCLYCQYKFKKHFFQLYQTWYHHHFFYNNSLLNLKKESRFSQNDNRCFTTTNKTHYKCRIFKSYVFIAPAIQSKANLLVE